jgi:hypothetical protein
VVGQSQVPVADDREREAAAAEAPDGLGNAGQQLEAQRGDVGLDELLGRDVGIDRLEEDRDALPP